MTHSRPEDPIVLSKFMEIVTAADIQALDHILSYSRSCRPYEIRARQGIALSEIILRAAVEIGATLDEELRV